MARGSSSASRKSDKVFEPARTPAGGFRFAGDARFFTLDHMFMVRAVRPLVICMAIFAALVGADGAERPPNVLLLLSDDQRADTIGALGNAEIDTPNLDRLARAGTTFTHNYCMGSMQGAVCIPSRAMLLTGRSLFRINEKLDGQRTWPENFADAGYNCFITGKWHNGAPSLQRVFAEGRALFLGGMTQQQAANAPVHDLIAGALVNKRAAGKLPTELFADCAVEFLQRVPREKPFLCYGAFNLPHDPRLAPAPYHEKTNARKPRLPANFLPEHPFDNGTLAVRDELLAPFPRTEAVVRQHLADYYAAIAFMDAQIGRILDALTAGGHAEKTIVVFSSDSGLAIGSHGLFGKQNLYEHSIRAPLILAGPDIPKGEQRNAFVYLFNLFPTLGEMTNVAAPSGNEGTSFAGILRTGRGNLHSSIFTAYSTTQRAVRDARWKLIVYPKIDRRQLFNLEEDPDETRDLASEPAHAENVTALTALMKEAQKKFGDEAAL